MQKAGFLHENQHYLTPNSGSYGNELVKSVNLAGQEKHVSSIGGHISLVQPRASFHQQVYL